MLEFVPSLLKPDSFWSGVSCARLTKRCTHQRWMYSSLTSRVWSANSRN